MQQHEKINYVEYAAKDLISTKAFFETAFGWTFTDYGPEYTSFSDQGLDGGFYQAPLTSQSDAGGALIVLYSNDLEATLAKVTAAGGVIVKPIFDFPGGRRFQFLEPSGNELAVWGDPR
jgi:uncharacterized protein